MGSGIAGKRRLPRQRSSGRRVTDVPTTAADGEAMPTPASEQFAELIVPQPLSYEERRDRWLRDAGTLWRAGSDSVEQQQT